MATQQANPSDYFSSYSDLSVHALMLKDKPRTLAYKNFVEQNKNLFAGKTVLDVGAGTGILSLFCASAGARQVYAVEASNIANLCTEIVTCNKMDSIITVIKGAIETIELPVDQVDIIVSEWMGFYLVHESMLDSVIFARDKWLCPNGFILPATATLYMTPVNMSDYVNENFRIWEKAYDYDFSPFQVATVSNAVQQPIISCVKPSQLLAEPQVVSEFDLKTVLLPEVENVRKTFTFEVKKSRLLHAFSLWFDVHFSAPIDSTKKNSVSLITLSTSPFAEETHWKQTNIFIPVSASLDEGERISCRIDICRDDVNKRHFNISVETLHDEVVEEDSGNGEDSELSEEEEDVSGHPVPCACGAARCRLIQALVERYDEEADALEHEAEEVEVNAEVEAEEVEVNAEVEAEEVEVNAEVEAARTVDIETMEDGNAIIGDDSP